MQIRQHPGVALWPTGIAAVMFFSLSVAWVVSIYQVPAEDAIKLVKSTLEYEIFSFLVMAFGGMFFMASRIDAIFPLSSKMSKYLSQELISDKPQAAIEHAFTLFEDHLRKRIGAGPEIYGEPLINQAFGPKDGKLKFGETENELKGIRNLVSGVYATFRNPRKHRVVDDDSYTASVIVVFLELLMKIADEAMLRGD